MKERGEGERERGREGGRGREGEKDGGREGEGEREGEKGRERGSINYTMLYTVCSHVHVLILILLVFTSDCVWLFKIIYNCNHIIIV